jgi:26S proteasome non-ATPase regulatory subunit 9
MGMPLPSASFPSSMAAANSQAVPESAEAARLMALQVAQERRLIDEEIQTHLSVLQEQGATMTTPLVDAQGFPLASTDVVAVRTSRSRIIALRNDREGLEGRMRDLLEVALAKNEAQEAAASPSAASAAQVNGGEIDSTTTQTAWARVNGRNEGLSMLIDTQEGSPEDWRQVGGMQTFAKINSVAESSPAQLADLKTGDELLTFGDLDATSAHRSTSRKDLGNLPSAVVEGREISLVVLRTTNTGQTSIKRLRLTPASGWGGRGLLGCHIVPL